MMRLYRPLLASLFVLSCGLGWGDQLMLPSESLKDLDEVKFFQNPPQTEFSTEPINRKGNGVQPVGALTGATIFVSAGHGWYEENGKWITQRGNSYGVLEDHSNAETVSQYLLPLLWNAGANVVTLRERDMQTNEVIVTEPEIYGTVLENRQNNRLYPKQSILETVEKSSDQQIDRDKAAMLKYTATLPEPGYYGVYVWYSPTTLGPSAKNAEFTIRPTSGPIGNVTWTQNLNEEPNTWKYMGTHYFAEGKGEVSVSNVGSKAGEFIAMNAVRFGGGMGSIAGAGESGTSGKPRWEESGLYYATFAGFEPGPVLPNRRWNQVHAMPRFAEWVAESLPKGRSVFLSWHTNASLDHQMSGISTYIYGKDAWDSVENFSGIPGSERLAYYVHNEVLQGIRNGYDESWTDVGIITRWLGETNPVSNGKTPAMLLENGFHDNPADAAYIVDPMFRKTAAWSAYKGLVKYYTNEVPGFTISMLIPETPQAIAVVQTEQGPKLIWEEPRYNNGDSLLGDRATEYRVYSSTNGFGFDQGFSTTEREMLLNDIFPGNGTSFHVRVAAVNAGGESLPSEVLSVTLPKAETQQAVLIVNAFDRLDSGLNRVEESGAQRGILTEMNSRNAPVYLASALSKRGYAVTSSSDEAFVNHDLSTISQVIWLYGNQLSATEDSAALKKLGEYARQGGRVIVSGSNLAEMPELALLNPTENDATPLVAKEREALDTEGIVQFDGINSVTLITPKNRVSGRYPAVEYDVFAGVEKPVLNYKTKNRDEKLPAATLIENNNVIAVGFPLECIQVPHDLQQVLEHLMDALKSDTNV